MSQINPRLGKKTLHNLLAHSQRIHCLTLALKSIVLLCLNSSSKSVHKYNLKITNVIV